LKFIRLLKRNLIKKSKQIFEYCGLNIARKFDYYSPLPIESKIKENINRWNKPSSMAGIKYDIEDYKDSLQKLMSKYWNEFNAFPNYNENTKIGFGPGYTELDALILYMKLREIKPKKYLEIGSGLSTYYCSLAAKKNKKEDAPLKIKCIEPYPFEKLYSIPDIEIIKDEVQNINKEHFTALEKGDVLFIDSSHVLKIDGDVAYIYLEILPILKPGVIIHIHDIPFPYNTPYPAEQWVLDQTWPMYWNEAMVLQAFLAFNTGFEIMMSAPLIRYHDEQFLKSTIPIYKTVKEEQNTFSSIWLKKLR
jgi:predicted O-methyltransferase YrrM